MVKGNFLSQPVMEGLAFQGDSYKKSLIEIFQRIGDMKPDEVENSEEILELKQSAFDNLGISLTIKTDTHIGPAVMVPQIDRNNVLINDWIKPHWKNSQLKSELNRTDSDGSFTGTVDLSTGKIGGGFSNLTQDLYLPVTFLTSSYFTAAEKAAVFQHEMGHVFYFYAFLNFMMTANRTLSELSENLANTQSQTEREFIIVEAKKNGKLSKDIDVEKASKITDSKVRDLIIVDSMICKNVSDTGSNFYDMSTYEMLSDQYSARFGFGRELVTSLDKLYRTGSTLSYRGWFGYLFYEALKIATLFISPPIFIILIMIDGKGNGSYDKPGARLKRIRNQIIEQTKDKNLGKELTNRLLDDIKVIDNILKDVDDKRQLFDILIDNIIPSFKRELDIDRLQKQLEDFAYNDLFLKTKEIKGLL